MRLLVLISTFLFGLSVASAQDASEPSIDEIRERLERLRIRNLIEERPDELAVSTVTDARCGVSDAELRETVEGVLIRSRIKPLDYATSPGFFRLTVVLSCLETGSAFAINVDFRDSLDGTAVRYGDGYGSFGTFSSDSDYVLEGVKRSVENAITDYLEANFDLSPE